MLSVVPVGSQHQRDDKGWGKDMLFRQTPIAPQLATWPSHHFHDIHHAAVHPGAKCWQMPLDPLCSFTALFPFPLTQSSVVALPALGPFAHLVAQKT